MEGGNVINEARGAKQMESANAIRAYQRKWFKETKERTEQGEPFAICHGDTVEEILTTMDIPFQVVNPWNALIAVKGMTPYYNSVLEQRGYDTSTNGILLISGGLASTMDNKPEVAPWGGTQADSHYRLERRYKYENTGTMGPGIRVLLLSVTEMGLY
jgi:hypothetical protein